jgi:hypothetical protein
MNKLGNEPVTDKYKISAMDTVFDEIQKAFDKLSTAIALHNNRIDPFLTTASDFSSPGDDTVIAARDSPSSRSPIRAALEDNILDAIIANTRRIEELTERVDT